jgi:hypothetical protein
LTQQIYDLGPLIDGYREGDATADMKPLVEQIANLHDHIGHLFRGSVLA